jgi:hypothetical protein
LLYGTLSEGSGQYRERLPTEHELAPARRIELERTRLVALMKQLKALKASSSPQPSVPRFSVTNEKDLHARLQTFHYGMLRYLVTMSRDLGLAYQLGRSLRDTANPPIRIAPVSSPTRRRAASNTPATPDPAAESRERETAITKQLAPGRVVKLQGWLATLESGLPDDSASIVSASMQKWSELVSVVFRKAPTRERELQRRTSTSEDVRELRGALLVQGDAWLNLLIGTESSSGLLTPESFVAAGEAALSRTARLIRRVLVHYWFALVFVALAVAGIVVIAARELGGAPKVVTQIVAVAGAFGITAKGIANSLVTLGKELETPIYASAQIDAKAWAITNFPAALRLSAGELRLLRRSTAGKSSAVMRALQN